VALPTVEPETKAGSKIAFGVTLPVLPTLNIISSSLVTTSSGANL
jgi:hypothetical protein